MKCPYPDCKKEGMVPPENLKAARPYGFCKHCERHSRAAISYDSSGKVYIHYSVTSLPKLLNEDDRKLPAGLRLSKRRKREILAHGWKSAQEFLDHGRLDRG